MAKIYYAELYGLRQGKYETLSETDVTSINWAELKPNSPFYFFVPREEKLRPEYEKGWKVTDIFPVNSTGIVTARDEFVIDFDQSTLRERMLKFASKSLSDEDIRNTYFGNRKSDKYPAGDTRGWKLGEARKHLQKEENIESHIKPCLYRPFDIRPIYYTSYMVDWSRPEVMRHMLAGGNVGLLWTRPMSPNYEFSVFTTRLLVDQCAIGNKSAGAGISYVSPLYLYPTAGEMGIQKGRRANLNPDFVAEIERRLGVR